jgi:hypothetical protein
MRIATGLDLPVDFATQTAAILARKGAGKTYAGAVIVEELIAVECPTVVLDPLGVWWGLRAAANGKDPGLPVTILGGEHGDVPLEPTAGKFVADLVVDHAAPFVLDLSSFDSNAAQDRFVTDFAERLYRAKAPQSKRGPLHLMVDEADSFAPQRPQRGQERMLGAWEAIVRRGRARGLGVTMITQRPAVLNKNVLTQIEMLVVMQITSPQDRKAIDEWVRGHGTDEERERVLGSLASLKVGEAWVWSPAWLGILQSVQIRKRITFDSSATPKPGERRIEPTRFASVDLDQLREQMSETIERAEQTDPKKLAARIRELERELARAHAETPEPKIEYVDVPTPVVPPLVGGRLDDIEDRLRDAMETVRLLRGQFGEIEEVPLPVSRKDLAVEGPGPVVPPPPASRVPVTPRPPVDPNAPAPRAGARRMLEVLARNRPMRLTLAQMATLAKVKRSGGTFSTYLGDLRRLGYIEVIGREVEITDAGLDFLGDAVPHTPVTVDEIRDAYRRTLRAGARRMFDLLVAQYPRGYTRSELADAADLTSNAGTFGTYLGDLRRNGLVEDDGHTIRAAEILFVAA